MDQQEIKTRGGKRTNSGRKATGSNFVSVGTKISKEQAEELKKRFPSFGKLFKQFINDLLKTAP